MIAAALLAAIATAGPLAGAQMPKGIAGDPHIQVARFEEAGAIGLMGFLGFQTTVQFEDGERIENVAIGDATSWQITPSKRADTLFVKPLGRGPVTNMTVITDRRTYSFALAVAGPKVSSAWAPWVLRFEIPHPKLVYDTTPPPPPPPISAEGKNVDYTAAGSGGILPARVFDDGVKTYFAWGPQAPVPAIFAVNPDGSESVVNFNMREGYSVIDQTAGRFVLRLGESKVLVTSSPGIEKRLPKKEKGGRRNG
jgi:type IV secretion system protein VirB9